MGYEVGTKYAGCQLKDVQEGRGIDQFHGAFGSETPIYIVEERLISDIRCYLLRIEKPGHEPAFIWKRSSEVDGRLKPYDWEDKKTKGK